MAAERQAVHVSATLPCRVVRSLSAQGDAVPHRWFRLTPLVAAILTVVLNTVGAFALNGSSPGGSADGAQVIAYYATHQDNNQRWSLLVAGTLLFFLVFAAFLRSYLRRVESGELLSCLSVLGAGCVFA